MRINNSREVDLARVDLFLQHRRNSDTLLSMNSSLNQTNLLLGGICWIDNDRILGLVVYNEIGVVVTTPSPWQRLSI